MFSFLDWILLWLVFVIISFLLWVNFFYVSSLSCFIIWSLIIFAYFDNSFYQIVLFFIINIFLLSFYFILIKKYIKKTNVSDGLETFIVKKYDDKNIIYIDSKVIDIESEAPLNEWDTVEIVNMINDYKFKVKKIM